MASMKLLMTSRLVRATNDTQLLSRLKFGVTRVSTAGICHIDRMDPVVRALKPAPFPYKQRPYKSWMFLLPGGSTISRFDENTAMVTIEGLPGSGKHTFAKKFAEATDMYHQPKPDFDFFYIRWDGLDYRMFNKLYFTEAQYPDIDMFLENPTHPKMGRMQFEMYRMRYFYYINAMAHLFNTGQGVVMERTPWSDHVFIDAMYKCGFTNIDHLHFCARVRHNTVPKIWRPHLVIYIDTPVEKALENIKKRNNPKEVNSPIWKTDFLKHIDTAYKEKIIPEYHEHAHVLIYPYKDDLDVNAILYDIEKISFMPILGNQKLCDWRIADDSAVSEWRATFTNDAEGLMGNLNCPSFDVDGFDYSSEAEQIQIQTERALAPSYWPGFDPDKFSPLQLVFKREMNFWEGRAINLFKSTTV